MMRNANGFTLIEVLVAITMMAIALAGMASMGVYTIQADTQGRRMSAATALAQAKLEELRGLRRSDPDWTVGSHSETGLQEDGGSGGAYTRVWEVEADYNGHSKLYRVTVTVSWNDGEDRQVRLASLYW